MSRIGGAKWRISIAKGAQKPCIYSLKDVFATLGGQRRFGAVIFDIRKDLNGKWCDSVFSLFGERDVSVTLFHNVSYLRKKNIYFIFEKPPI